MTKLEEFVRDNGYELLTGKPLNPKHGHVFELKGDLIIKVATDEYEIQATKKLINFDSDLIVKFHSLREYKDYSFIVMEKLKPLDKKTLRKLSGFVNFCRVVIFINYFYEKIFPKKKTLTFESFKRFQTKNVKSWFKFSKDIIETCREKGIEYPTDFLHEHNLGLRGDKVVAFDIRDKEEDFFYNKLG